MTCSHQCPNCDFCGTSGPQLGGHRKGHRLWEHIGKAKHGTIAGYHAETRAAKAAGKKVRHCKACRDRWNEYYRLYKARQAILRAQNKLAQLKRKVL